MKIVVVAEQGFTRSTVNVNLRSSGYEVVEAEPTCLLDVMAVLRGVLPQLVILDMELTTCNGETLVRVIREDPFLRGLPLVVVMDRGSDEAAERIRRWRYADVLTKPLQVEDLLRAVEEQFSPLDLDKPPAGAADLFG